MLRLLLPLLLSSAAIFAARITSLESAALAASTFEGAAWPGGVFSSYILYFQASYARGTAPALAALTPAALPRGDNSGGTVSTSVTTVLLPQPVVLTQPHVVLTADYQAQGPDTPIVNPGQLMVQRLPPSAMTEVELPGAGVSNLFLDAPIQQGAVARAVAIIAGDSRAPGVFDAVPAHSDAGPAAGVSNLFVDAPIQRGAAQLNPGPAATAPEGRTDTTPAASGPPSGLPRIDNADLAVPEPSMAFGVMFALAGLGWLRIRRSIRPK